MDPVTMLPKLLLYVEVGAQIAELIIRLNGLGQRLLTGGDVTTAELEALKDETSARVKAWDDAAPHDRPDDPADEADAEPTHED